jgi:hypothetical protein
MSEKVVEIIILSITKTALKPKIKLRVPAMTLGLARGSRGLMPPTMLRYEGIRGSTQGDRNENNPAPKANKQERFSVIRLIILDDLSQCHGM